jgi:hypothetical protein
MANKVRGERTLKGVEDYTVVFTSNAIAQAEGELGYGVGVVIGNYMTGAFSIHESRTLLWAALLKHHGPLTIPDAGDILDEILDKGKDLGKVFEVIVEALNDAMPFKEGGDNPNVTPVALQTGTRPRPSNNGKSSSKPRAVSD